MTNVLGNNMSYFVSEAKKLQELPTPNELFSLDWEPIKELHAEGVCAAFREMLQKIALLKKLADDFSINEIEDINDVVPLLFPHTMYKSYPLSFIENKRYDLLNKWLQKLTAIDLSVINTSICESLDDWLDQIDQLTPLRPNCTSGTSGKISILPLSTLEKPGAGYAMNRMSFGNEPGIKSREDMKTAILIAPSPRKGKSSPQRAHDAVLDYCYDGNEEMIVTLGGQVSTDVLWLTGRIRAAEAKGELDQLRLTPGLQELREKIMESKLDEPKRLETFWEEVVTKYKGQRVVFLAGWMRWLELANFLEKTGLKMEFDPGSVFTCGGGTKGFQLPEGWQAKLAKYIQLPISEMYGMTELCGSVGRKCSAGHYHLPPWIVPFLINPDTMEPLPRFGRQTGRFGFFDLTAQAYWGGFISGDKVTYEWEGGCPCGRTGPFIHDGVTRYSEIQGDDKITCQKAPYLYDEAQDFLINL